MIMALGANVDVGLILIRERAGGRDEIVVRREHRVAQLSGEAVGLVLVVANDTDDAVIGVTQRQWLVFEHRDSRVSGVAPPATIYQAG